MWEVFDVYGGGILATCEYEWEAAILCCLWRGTDYNRPGYGYLTR